MQLDLHTEKPAGPSILQARWERNEPIKLINKGSR